MEKATFQPEFNVYFFTIRNVKTSSETTIFVSDADFFLKFHLKLCKKHFAKKGYCCNKTINTQMKSDSMVSQHLHSWRNEEFIVSPSLILEVKMEWSQVTLPVYQAEGHYYFKVCQEMNCITR